MNQTYAAEAKRATSFTGEKVDADGRWTLRVLVYFVRNSLARVKVVYRVVEQQSLGVYNKQYTVLAHIQTVRPYRLLTVTELNIIDEFLANLTCFDAEAHRRLDPDQSILSQVEEAGGTTVGLE